MSSNKIQKQEEEVNLIVKKMSKFCKFNGKKKQQQAENNNDAGFVSEYQPTSKSRKAEHQATGRMSSSGNKSTSSTSSLATADDYYEDSEEDTSQLIQMSSVSTNSSSGSLNSSSTDQSSSSGRSSVNKSPTNSMNEEEQYSSNEDNSISSGKQIAQAQLNPVSNLFPEDENVYKIIDTIRVRTVEHFDKELGQDGAQFDESDLIEFRKNLPQMDKKESSLAFRLISRYINQHKVAPILANPSDQQRIEEDIVEPCLEQVISLLKFRCSFKLNDIRGDQFSKEFYTLCGVFPFGYDKQKLPILYMRAKVHRRWPKVLDETFRRYLAWQLNLLTKSESRFDNEVKRAIGSNKIEKDGSFAICFDCSEVGYSCLDMDFLRFIVNLLVQYYPTYCRYAICLDLPWLFRSVWKLVRSWLPEEAQNTVQLITAKQITDFIDPKQVPNCINYRDQLKACDKPAENKHRMPENWSELKSIDELGPEMGLTSNDIKYFKTHVEKLRKEYEKLGAV